MDTHKWIQEIINSEERFTLPIMTHPGIEMIGFSVKEAVQNGNIHAKAIKALADKFPSIASTSIMDLTVEAEAFGCSIKFPENEMPQIIGHLVDSDNVEKLGVPSLSAGRIPEYLKAAKQSMENKSDKPFFAGVIGPFSLAGRLYGMSEIFVACLMEPDKVLKLLEKCKIFIKSYCFELKKLGCSGVIIAEPAAGLLSNDDCYQFSTIFVREIIDTLQDNSFMFVLHNCGNRGNCTDAMLVSGAKAYHFGNAISMKQTLDACPRDVLIMGNIDPVGTLKMMSPIQIKEVVADLLKQTEIYPNFVLSTGCDVPPHVPIKNINAYYDALYEFNQRSFLTDTLR